MAAKIEFLRKVNFRLCRGIFWSAEYHLEMKITKFKTAVPI